MSQHPSLKSSKKGKKQRTVLKRYERFFELKEKSILKDGSSVFGMPKLKIARVKLKKEKAEEKPEEAQAPSGAEAGAQKETTAKSKPETKEKGKEKEKK